MKKAVLIVLTSLGLGVGASANSNGIPTECYAQCDISYLRCVKTQGLGDTSVCETGRFFCQEKCLNDGGQAES